VPDTPKWSENLLFTLDDPANGIALWLHLGTVPGKWTMWEDRVLVMLPGDEGCLSLRGYRHTAPERRPAGPVFGAYRLAAIVAKLLSMFAAQGRMPAEFVDEQHRTGLHVTLLAGLVDLTPPDGVTPVVPDVRI
jgi:hypothetical protein